jgi:hypothetical protein
MKGPEYANRHIEARIAKTADDGKSVAPQEPTSTSAVVLTLFPKSTAASARKKRPNAPVRRPSPVLEWQTGYSITEIFLGPVEAARAQARLIINEPRATGYTRIVEGWQQLSDGQIQFTIRTMFH